jgi:hypothetical protein
MCRSLNLRCLCSFLSIHQYPGTRKRVSYSTKRVIWAPVFRPAIPRVWLCQCGEANNFWAFRSVCRSFLPTLGTNQRSYSKSPLAKPSTVNPKLSNSESIAILDEITGMEDPTPSSSNSPPCSLCEPIVSGLVFSPIIHYVTDEPSSNRPPSPSLIALTEPLSPSFHKRDPTI